MSDLRPDDQDLPAPPDERIWVLDDPRAGPVADAIGIAERLGAPFRRIPLAWNWLAPAVGLVGRGSLLGLARASRNGLAGVPSAQAVRPGPALVISAGHRAAAVSLWLQERCGSRVTHCMRPGIGGLRGYPPFDLVVISQHDRPRTAANVLPVLGTLHRISPLVLRQAETAWRERLSHLPHPRVVLLVGGPLHGHDLVPAAAHRLGTMVSLLTAERRGTVLAMTSRHTGSEATDALAAGLGHAMHVLYRWGEPGGNPYLGFLASADVIVVTADSMAMISEACVTTAPVFVALPELASARHRRLIATLHGAGHLRLFARDLSGWPRVRLDEAERVAAEVRRRFALA